ncbi:hypothetical protein AB0872_02660 [Microbacterium sp. NPDC047426]
MPPLATTRSPRARAERILLARVVTAVGLALLLVVGAWSTAHGPGDSHATLCLAAGTSAAEAETTDGAPVAAAVAVAAPEDSTGMAAVACTAAALCCLTLVLLLGRRMLRGPGTPLGRTPRTTPPLRAMPRPRRLTPSLAQLSLSRT